MKKSRSFFQWVNAKYSMAKRTTKDGHKKKGGALLGQGACGCAYSPVIPCKSNEVFVNGTVGKVMADARSAKEEMEVASMIKAADPKGVYTNSPLGRCDVARSKVVEENPNTKCVHLKGAYTHPQIVYPHKGVSLDAWQEDLFTKDSFAGFVHLAKGLEMLARNRLVHMDLKRENVIRMDNKKLMMIDFGLSRRFEDEEVGDFYSEDNEFLKVDYFVFPPDFYIYEAVTSALWLNADEHHKWYGDSSLSGAVVGTWDVDTLATFVTKKVTANMQNSFKIVKGPYERIGWTLEQFTNEIRAVVKRLLWNGIPRNAQTASEQIGWVESKMNEYVDRVDVYGFGHIMLKHYLKSDVSKSSTPFSHSCANIIARCIHADPVYRYDPAGLVGALTSAGRLIGRVFPPLQTVSDTRVPVRPRPAWHPTSRSPSTASESSTSRSPSAKRSKRSFARTPAPILPTRSAKRAFARTPAPILPTQSARVAPSGRTPTAKRGTV